MSANPFTKPYHANDDNRTIVGIDCPVCKAKNSATPLETVPADRAVRLFFDTDLNVRPLGNINTPYGGRDKLPEGLSQTDTVTFWCCENCQLATQQSFSGMAQNDLNSYIYTSDYVKFIPQVSSELGKFRANFLIQLLQHAISELEILLFESSFSSLLKEMRHRGLSVDSANIIGGTPVSLKGKEGKYDVTCAFGLIERVPDLEHFFRMMISTLKAEGFIILSVLPFNHLNQSDRIFLSPRNGYYRLFSPKSLQILLNSLELHSVKLTTDLYIVYKEKLPAFAERFAKPDFSLKEYFESGGESEDESPLEPAEEEPSAPAPAVEPSPVLHSGQWVSVRETRYGMTVYNHKDALVGQSLENYGEYLREDQELLTQLLRPHWVAFDIAANIGMHTMMMAPLLHRGGIHAFEPYIENQKLLHSNLTLNEIDNVAVYPEAVGAFSGVTRLAASDPLNPGSMAAKAWSVKNSGSEVSLITVDSLQPSHCDFIHLSAPTCEPSIVQGARETIARLQPSMLINCVSEQDFQSIFLQLSELDYRMYWHIQPFFSNDNFFTRKRNIFGNAGVAKILALHRSKRQNVGLMEITSTQDWIA